MNKLNDLTTLRPHLFLKTSLVLLSFLFLSLLLSCSSNDTSNPSSSTQTTKYTVTFDSKSGPDVQTQTIAEGSTAQKPTDPTKDDYFFKGW